MINSSVLKSLGLFWANLANSQRYLGLVERKDLDVFHARLNNEGISYLTTTLPELGKALDTFHSSTQWEAPNSFAKDKGTGLPRFLGKAIKLALDGDSLAVECVRQLSYLFYKLEVDHDKALVARFLDQFESVDRDLYRSPSLPSVEFNMSALAAHVGRMQALISMVLRRVDPLDIRPSHGSGATACQTRNSDKWHKLRYFPKLDAVYCYADYFYYSYTHLVDEYDRLEASAESSPCARVVLVPKDSRGPRVISCEPAELMFIQQGIMKLLYRVLETNDLTKGQVNFTDQSINRCLAQLGSIDSSFATLDLSEASDRVSLDLVRDVFPSDWVQCLEACRSEETILPSGKRMKLNKFAPMGSSCCFPVEALVFWASCQATFVRLGVKSPSYVYGDDIIIPRTCAVEEVMFDLESIGLKINKTKSYTQGPFRESCGGEYHFGNDVTPVKIKKVLGSSDLDVANGADLANDFIAKFGYADALPLVRLIEQMVGYVFPRTLLDVPCTLRVEPDNWPTAQYRGFKPGKAFSTGTINDALFRVRWCKPLQRREYRILQVSARALALREPTWCELLRKELTAGSLGDISGDIQSTVNPVDRLDPGEYVDTHSARGHWVWTWLD